MLQLHINIKPNKIIYNYLKYSDYSKPGVLEIF